MEIAVFVIILLSCGYLVYRAINNRQNKNWACSCANDDFIHPRDASGDRVDSPPVNGSHVSNVSAPLYRARAQKSANQVRKPEVKQEDAWFTHTFSPLTTDDDITKTSFVSPVNTPFDSHDTRGGDFGGGGASGDFSGSSDPGGGSCGDSGGAAGGGGDCGGSD